MKIVKFENGNCFGVHLMKFFEIYTDYNVSNNFLNVIFGLVNGEKYENDEDGNLINCSDYADIVLAQRLPVINNFNYKLLAATVCDKLTEKFYEFLGDDKAFFDIASECQLIFGKEYLIACDNNNTPPKY